MAELCWGLAAGGRGTSRASLRSMSRAPRRRWLLAAGLVLAGCLSPTLPLPPPSKPTVEGPDQQGMVTLSGRTEEGADVFAANLRTGDIVGKIDIENDGLYVIVIAAEVGDEMQLWYTLGTEESPSIVFKIDAP